MVLRNSTINIVGIIAGVTRNSDTIRLAIVAAECSAQEVRAGDGAVAAGRDIVNSQITIGIPPEQLAGIIEAGRKDLKDLTERQKHKSTLLKRILESMKTRCRHFLPFSVKGRYQLTG